MKMGAEIWLRIGGKYDIMEKRLRFTVPVVSAVRFGSGRFAGTFL